MSGLDGSIKPRLAKLRQRLLARRYVLRRGGPDDEWDYMEEIDREERVVSRKAYWKGICDLA